MVSVHAVFNHLRRLVVSVVLMGLLLFTIAPAAQAASDVGAPGSSK